MPVVTCVKPKEYEEYDFLKQLDAKGRTFSCKPHGIGVEKGSESHDGVVVISDVAKPRKHHILTDDGRLYKNLTTLDVERFHLGILGRKPNARIAAKRARSFIAKVWGTDELSAKGERAYCSERPGRCGTGPNTDPIYLARRGEYGLALAIFSQKIIKTASNPSRNNMDLMLLHNNYAWIVATATDSTIRQQYIRIAILSAKTAVRLAEKDSGHLTPDVRKIHVGNYKHTLAMAYTMNGEYTKALKAIEGYDAPKYKALHEMIEGRQLWQGLYELSSSLVSGFLNMFFKNSASK